MNRYVFVALVVVLGVTVQGMPQHQFQPYRFSYNAGKSDDTASLGTRGAEPMDPVIPIEESAPSPAVETLPIEQQTLTNVDEAPVVETTVSDAAHQRQFQNLWKQAAKNLVNIPHLLKWVSSLNSESLMSSVSEQQKVVSTQSQNDEIHPKYMPEVEPQESSVFVHHQNDQNAHTETEIVTEVYETDFTTESPFIEEITSEPDPIIAEPEYIEQVTLSRPLHLQRETIQIQPKVVEQEMIMTKQKSEILPQPEHGEVILPQTEKVAERILRQPIQAEQAVIYTEPEPIEVVPVQTKPIEVAYIQPEPVKERAYIQPAAVEERAYIQPEAVEERAYIQPEPVEERAYIQPEPIEERAYTQPEPVEERAYTQSEPVEEWAYIQPELVEERAYIQPQPISKVVYTQPEPTEVAPFAQPETIEEVSYVQPELVQKEIIWEQPQHQPQFTYTYEKSAPVENKKTVSKFKYNRYDNRKQPIKKGKTLFSFAPAPQESPFSFDSFTFPAYSYSISHQPTNTYFGR